MTARRGEGSRAVIGIGGRLVVGSAFSAGGLVVRAILQAAYLVAVSRWLGVEGYGVFGASVATAVLFMPISSWGAGNVYLECVTRQPRWRALLWRQIAGQVLATGIFTGVCVFGAARALFDSHLALPAVAAVLIAEIVALPLTHTCTTVFVAIGRAGLAAVSVCAIPLARLCGVVVLVGWGVEPSLTLIALGHGIASVLAGLVTMWGANRATRLPAQGDHLEPLPDVRRRMREGAPYALGALFSFGYLEVDKILVLELAGPDSAGAYTAAFRVAMVLFIPVSALLANALPRLMAVRTDGAASELLARVLLAAVACGTAGALLASMIAPAMPFVFGDDFADSAELLAFLAWWLPLAAVHQSGATALLAAGGKKARMFVEAAGACVVVLANWILLPSRGADGAVMALLCAEVAMASACWACYRRRARRPAWKGNE